MSNNEMSDKSSSLEAFNVYMLSALERSSEYSHRLKQRSHNAIQLFSALLTGLVGAAILTITSVDDEAMKLSLIVLILVTAGGSGTLTYLWVLVSIVYEWNEQPLRFFLEKYFRDLNPSAFDKYGLSRLLGHYTRFQDTGRRSVTKMVSLLSALMLAVFSSVMVATASYLGLRVAAGSGSLLVSSVTGAIWLLVLLLIERLLARGAKKNLAVVRDILNTFHIEEAPGEIETVDTLPPRPKQE